MFFPQKPELVTYPTVGKLFFRSGVACIVTQAADGWAWDPYIGVEQKHRFSGERYIEPSRGIAGLHRVPICPVPSDSDVLKAKSWFTFSPKRPLVPELVIEELKKIADSIGNLEDKITW